MKILLAPDAVADVPPKATDAQPPAQTPPSKPPEPKPDELAGITAFARDHFTGPADRAEAKKDIEKARGTPAKKEETPPGGKPAQKAQKKPKTTPQAPPPAAPLNEEKLAEAVGRGVATALSAKQEKKAETPPPVESLPVEERERVEVLERMETMFPDRYKGLSARYTTEYITAQKKLEAYAADWESKHPGQKFDENAPEHEEFMEVNAIDEPWSDLHFSKAAGALGAEVVGKESSKELQAKVDELSRQNRIRDAQGTIDNLKTTTETAFWTGVFGEDKAPTFTSNGALDRVKIAELTKADPLGTPIRMRALGSLQYEAAELHKLMNGLDQVLDKPPSPNDPDYSAKLGRYHCHQNLDRFYTEQEQHFASLPPEDKVNERGQTFVTAPEYFKMTKAEQARHWRLTEADLMALRATSLAVETQKVIDTEKERLKQIAVSMGWTVTENGQPKETQHTEKSPEEILLEATRGNDKPQSPTSTPESRLAASKHGSDKPAMDGLNIWARRHLGIAS